MYDYGIEQRSITNVAVSINFDGVEGDGNANTQEPEVVGAGEGDTSKQSFIVVEIGHMFELTEDEDPYRSHGEILWKVVEVADDSCKAVAVWPESAVAQLACLTMLTLLVQTMVFPLGHLRLLMLACLLASVGSTDHDGSLASHGRIHIL